MRTAPGLFILIVLSSGCQTHTNQRIAGHFDGYIEYQNKKLNLNIDFQYRDGKQIALLSIPDNLQLDKPFTTVEYNPPDIELGVKDGETPVTIHATLIKNIIEGKVDGSIPATIHLIKVDNYTEAEKTYTVEAVLLDNNGIKLLANLYLPKTTLQSPAVIIVSGSGNHTRDEYNGAAALFASSGIATFTVDKRNVTNIDGLNLKQVNSDIVTMSELVGDVETAFKFLQNQKKIKRDKIGLLGFSLGAVEVPVVAAKHQEIAFVIAISGNATTDKEFIINQGLNKLKEKSFNEHVIRKAEHFYNDLFNYAKTRQNAKALQLKLDEAYSEQWGAVCFPRKVPNEDELKYLLTWNNFEFDPADYWRKINVPCLVVYGEKDKYIPIEKSINILNDIFKTRKGLLTLKVYPASDHTIRLIPAKENFEFPRYADGYINDVQNWLLKQTH